MAVLHLSRGVSRRPRVPRGAVWLVDNYDSFTENLAHGLAMLGATVVVARHDEVGVDRVLASRPRALVLSPGPRTPREAGISVRLVRAVAALDRPLPLLGVCLGHQAIAAALGGRVVRAREPVHGRATKVRHAGRGVLEGLPSPFPAARYHSLVVDERSLPRDLVATAWSEAGEVMALAHRSKPIEGVQFHPESFLTPAGPRILAAFLRGAGLRVRPPRAVVR
jgi:anthranilate synthase/aminodeoxychorismate synthase-like glutamine amidotransferase